MVANSRSKLLKLRTTRVLPRAFANSCDKSMSNPSNWPDVSLYDSNGGNGTLVPTTNVALAAGLKTNHPTPTPARNVMTAITTTIAVLMPLAAPERLASGGGAPPPSAIPGANACHYLNVTGKSDDWTENELAAAQRPHFAARLRHSSRTSSPASRTSRGMFNAGMYRIAESPHGKRISPCWYASFSIASRSFGSGFFECLSVTNSVACIMPRPRRSPMNSYRSAISSSRRARWSPTFALRATRPSSSITSSVASDAAHATGFPPNVFECLPLSLKSISAGYTAAPIGSPPPRHCAGHGGEDSGALLRLARGQRQRALGPAVERAEEREEHLALRVALRDLDRGLVRLGAGVAEEHLLPMFARGDFAESLGEGRLDFVVEVGPREMGELRCLARDRLDDFRMGVTDVEDRDPGREVDQDVAVDVFDDRAGGPFHDDWRRLRRGCNVAMVPRDDLLRLRARGSHFDVGDLHRRTPVPLTVWAY